MSTTFDQLRAERLQRERRARRTAALVLSTSVAVTLAGVLMFERVRAGELEGPATSAGGNGPAVAASASRHPGGADPEIEQTLQEATGLAASLLASTRSTEVARSALVAVQDLTGCAPKEGGPALVHLGNRAEKGAELVSRADFYSTAEDNGREYATHATAYLDRGTVVHVAVAWECVSGA